MNLPKAKYLVHPMSASLFPMVMQAQEESQASPYRIYQHNTVERCPSFQTIFDRSRRGYLMHGLVTEPCLFTGRGVRLVGEYADVDTLSPSVSNLKFLTASQGGTDEHQHLLTPVRSTPHYQTQQGIGNWTLLRTGQPSSHHQESSVNLDCGGPFPDSTYHEPWKNMAPSEAPVADKATPMDDFEHDLMSSHLSSQNEYSSGISTPHLGIGWNARLDGADSHLEPPVLDCQHISFTTQADSEPCRRTAECSLHADQGYFSWRQLRLSPLSARLSTPEPTCSLDICSGWSSSPQGQTLKGCDSFRSFTLAPKHEEAPSNSRVPPGRCILRCQDKYDKSDGSNTYEPCGTSSGVFDAALPFTTSTNKVSPEETASSIAFPSQYFLGNFDQLENPLSLQHTRREAACVTSHALRASHAVSYGLTEPEPLEHQPVCPQEFSSWPTGSFSAPEPEFSVMDRSSSPCLSDSMVYTTGIPTKKNARRNSKDGFLIRSKLSGMSYREIKVKGRFKEAESTLRGRFRTLTKRKEQRVRKPQWQEMDVSILHLAHACRKKLMVLFVTLGTATPRSSSGGCRAVEGHLFSGRRSSY